MVIGIISYTQSILLNDYIYAYCKELNLSGFFIRDKLCILNISAYKNGTLQKGFISSLF